MSSVFAGPAICIACPKTTGMLFAFQPYPHESYRRTNINSHKFREFKRAPLMLDVQYTHTAVPPVLLWMSSLRQGARNNEMTENPKTFPIRWAAGLINTCRWYLFSICSFSAAEFDSVRQVRHWVTAQAGDDLSLGFTAHPISASAHIPVVARLSRHQENAHTQCTVISHATELCFFPKLSIFPYYWTVAEQIRGMEYFTSCVTVN